MSLGGPQSKRRGLLLSTVAIAAVAIAVAGASTASGSSTKAGAAKPGEWPLPGADLQNTRNVPGPINGLHHRHNTVRALAQHLFDTLSAEQTA